MKSSPLTQVKERFTDKAGLVKALESLTTADLWLGRINEDKGLVFFTARRDRGRQRHLFSQSLAGGTPVQLTSEPGWSRIWCETQCVTKRRPCASVSSPARSSPPEARGMRSAQ